jgi:hypothetical protein
VGPGLVIPDVARDHACRVTNTFYGGVSNEEIPQAPDQVVTEDDHPLPPSVDRLGIHHWAAHGIQGRGVFLDVARFAERAGMKGYEPMGNYAVSVDELKRVAELQGVGFRDADILVVRFGTLKVRRRVRLCLVRLRARR